MEIIPHKYIIPTPVVMRKAPKTVTKPLQRRFSNMEDLYYVIIIKDDNERTIRTKEVKRGKETKPDKISALGWLKIKIVFEIKK